MGHKENIREGGAALGSKNLTESQFGSLKSEDEFAADYTVWGDSFCDTSKINDSKS